MTMMYSEVLQRKADAVAGLLNCPCGAPPSLAYKEIEPSRSWITDGGRRPYEGVCECANCGFTVRTEPHFAPFQVFMEAATLWNGNKTIAGHSKVLQQNQLLTNQVLELTRQVQRCTGILAGKE